jgi:hypothetical protein
VRRLKYRRGRRFRTTAALVKWILAGRYTIVRDKRMHPGWMRSLQVGYLDRLVKWGSVYRAEENR